MGKAAMCIRLLQILNTGRVYNRTQLAGLLDTNPRNIAEYVKELDEVAMEAGSGFYIETVPGRYGGYKLNGNISIPAIKLTLEEKTALLESFNYSVTKKDFPKKKDLTTAFSKVASNIEIEEKDNKLVVVDKYQLQMDQNDINTRYAFIEDAINKKRSVEILYLSLKSGEKVHVVDPYKLINYNNSWFFLAWDHENGKVFSFKLNRIKTFKLLDKRFVVHKYFRAEDYYDETGFKQNGEYHHVVLIATGTRAMLLKERVYGKNQTVTELDDGSIKVEMDMQNDNTMVAFVLQAGGEMKVLEPQWLIDMVKEEVQKIEALYSDK